MFYLKLIIIIIAANTQITGDRYSYIIEKDGSLSKYMHGPGYKYTEPYTDGILLNGSFFTKDKLNISGLMPIIGEAADGINALIYFHRGDYVNAGLSTAAMIPFAGWAATGTKLGIKTVNAVKGGMKMLNQFNSAESLIQGAGKLSRVKGAQQGFVKGNVDDIFKSITQGGKQLAPNRVQLPNGIIITKYSSSTTGVPTLQINKGNQIFKIRIE